MPSQDEIASDLRRAVDLKSLVDQARVLGIDHVLDHPLEALYELPELGAAGADLLDDLSDELGDLPTLGDLVTDPDLAETVRREATAKQRRQLQAALAAHFAREAVGAERRDKAPAQAALAAWAAEHQVSELLLAPLRMLEKDCDAHLRHWPFRRPTVAIRFLFEPDTPATRGIPGKVMDGLKRAARRFLERGAAERRAGLAEEAARLATPPVANPAERALRERLLAGRAAVREFALPRPRSAWPRMAVRFEPDPPTWVVTEEEWPHRTRVELGLQGADPLVPVCTCCRGAPAQCAHALTAIDVFLDHLADPGNERDNAEILAELARPGWARTLADLDARLAPAAEPERFRLRWRIQQRGKLLTVMPAMQRPTKAGGRSRGSRARASGLVRALPADALPADREAATLLALAERVGVSSSRDLVVRAVRALVGHDGVTLATPPHQPLTVRRGTIGFEAIDHPAGGVVLQPTVAGDPIDANLLADALDPEDDLAVVVDEERRMCNLVEGVRPEARAVVALLARRGGVFPSDAVAALTERLPALAARVPLRLPPSLRGTEVEADERTLLRLDLLDEAGMRVRALVRPLAEGPAYAPAQGPPEIVGWRDAGRVHVRRDLAGERARVRAAVSSLSLSTEAEQEPFVWMLGPGEQALDLLSALRDAEDRYVVEWAGEPRRVTRAATTADLRLRIEDKRDWFGLSGGLDVDGVTVPLAQILEAMRGGRRYVEVKGGVWVRLGEELRARLEPAGDFVGGRGGLEVSPLAAPAIADLVGDNTVMTRNFQRLLLRIRDARESIPELPAELAGILRDYQVTGYRWLARLAAWGAGACLADDMGLGKTIQTLALLSARASLGPALVVAPTSVGWNWLREARRFTPSLRPIHYREVDRKRTLSELGAGDVLVISYGLLARDAEELAGLTFSTLVLDEAQAIKNPATQRARAAAALSADFRLALTGTPLENRLGELWSLFRVVTPGLLGSWERFRERFAAPIETDDDEGRRGALARLVRPFILRRMKADVAPELPARTEVREDIVLSPPERALYDELRRAALTALAAPTGAQPQQRRFHILAALTRLRQLACHPRLVDERSPITSSKLERCLELIEELRAGNHRALVFSQFTGHLALLREALDASAVPYLYLDGQTPAGQRQQRVDAFQRGEGDLFLISLKAGGTGLNLTGADYVIHLDPWWNPAVEDQATDRAHRIGQERPVTVYRLVARGTIEEGILDLHADKRRLVAGVLEGTGTATSVSTEELIRLLREGGIED